MQQAASTPGDVDGPRRTLAKPVADKEAAASPNNRRRRSLLGFPEIGRERPFRQRPLRRAEHTPPSRRLAFSLRQTGGIDLADSLGEVALADGKLEMLCDRARGTNRIKPIRLGRQDESAGRGAISHDSRSAARNLFDDVRQIGWRRVSET